MELNNMVRITVSTVDPNKSVQLSVQTEGSQTVAADTVHQKTCTSLGIEESNWKHFTLVRGTTSGPLCRYRQEDMIKLPVKDLCFHKWIYSIASEKRDMFSDPVSLHLLCEHAKRDIDKGKLQPDTDQLRQLEEFCDPDFPVEVQYVALCQSLPHYPSEMFTDCVACRNVNIRKLQLSKGSVVTVFITTKGIELQDNTHKYLISWSKVKSWSQDVREETITFNVVPAGGSPCLLALTSTQVPYMLAVIAEIIRTVQLESEELPTFHASMVHHSDDPAQAVLWENVFFDPAASPAPDICDSSDLICL